MPEQAEPNRTVTAPQDRSPPIAGADETTPHAGSQRPKFGAPAVAGEVGVLGPYRIVKQLGAGGMGAVYLAVDTRLDRQLALKVMLPAFAADRDAKERFLREARAAANISHDNVVTVFEADERAGVPYIAMQLLRGYPLDEYLRTKGAPPLAHVIRVARETASGLAAAHAVGLVHRDIKTANLWLEAPNGRVKILDFGLAKPISTDAELTKSGAVIGTPAYMSPEQALGAKVDHRTDLFSLGAVLYRLCAGKTPFAGPNVMAVMMALGSDDPTPVRVLNPSVPEPLAALIHQLLAKQPDQRPQSANEVAKRLRAILDERLSPNAAVVAPSGTVPAVLGADESGSRPVVVHALPHQPPIVVPMHVTARAEDVFTNLGAEKPTEESAHATHPAREPKKGRKGVRIGAGVAVLLAAVAGVVVVATMNGGKREPEAKAPDELTQGEKAEPAKSSGPLPATYKNRIGMEFVKVPKGRGWLGGGGGKPGETKVTFDKDFYLGKYEVTQEEWEKVMGTNPSLFSRTGERSNRVVNIPDAELNRFPVESISWDAAQRFLALLNKQPGESGWGYRLPTADEWEYACRGGPMPGMADSTGDFYFFDKPADQLSPLQANFAAERGDGIQRTCQVGRFQPNRLGLYDMHGNVWEWCDDTPNPGDGIALRVTRGGGWGDDSALRCRAALRESLAQAGQDGALGLRVARVPAGK